ncbi:MAG TPA: hydroxyacid dehydrogenase, partial [Terrimicrobiaceae bacterium]|nr:hydroxyacid dehydrogenase [Terrimicrobiaceae bacterium]
MPKPRVLLAVNRHWFPTVFSPADLARLGALADVISDDPPANITREFLLRHLPGADAVFTSWDTAKFDSEVLAAAPDLKLLCHAAGSVRPVVSDAVWRQGIRVTSAASAISYGVAEYCLGLILLASKRVFWTAQAARHGGWQEASACFGGLFELYQQDVGVIGTGHIGSHLVRLLKNFDCNVFAYDPFLSEDRAAAMGCTKLDSLEELFSRCRAISLNAPSNEGTRHMLRGHHFAALRDGSVFINTAGSIQIQEEEFVNELKKGRFVACIDRCEFEPCALDHPYRTLPNVILTPHIAGVAAENRFRIGTYTVDALEAFFSGTPLPHEVTEAQL